MGNGRESDGDLTRRYNYTRDALRRLTHRRDRSKPGPWRDRLSRSAGSLTFTLLGLRAEMEERGLSD